jgi:hypothetical protein
MNKNYLIIGLIILALVVIGVIAARQPEPTVIEPEVNNGTQTEVASLTVSDQVVAEETIVVDSVYAEADGWVVLHRTTEEGDLDPSSMVGVAAVPAGSTENLVVELTEAVEGGEVLVAMLHVDTGVAGEYEFSEETPDLDSPVQVDGEVVVSFFAVSLEVAEEEVEAEAEEETELDVEAEAEITE